MKVDRVVCDTNVLISAAIVPSGKPRRVVELVRSNGRLLICADAIVELATRLARPKFDRYLSHEARQSFLDGLVSVAEIVPVSGTLHVCRDPDDDKILETAIEGKADCLVTGDKDLLALRPCGENGSVDLIEDAQYREVAILRPHELLSLASG